MLQPLNVIYLHAPAEDDGTVLPEMEYGLSDAFRAFCKEAFSNGQPLDFPRLKLLVAHTPQEMGDLLFDVVATEGPGAVHGLFVRGKTLLVEVLARAEESRVARIP